MEKYQVEKTKSSERICLTFWELRLFTVLPKLLYKLFY